MRIKQTIVMITAMTVIKEKEIIATKETWLIFENETERI